MKSSTVGTRRCLTVPAIATNANPGVRGYLNAAAGLRFRRIVAHDGFPSGVGPPIMSRAFTEAELFDWWLENGGTLTLEESRPKFAEWLADVREALRDFWGNGS